MQLDAIETGLQGVARRGGKILHDLADFRFGQRAGCGMLHHLAHARRRPPALRVDEDFHAFGHQR